MFDNRLCKTDIIPIQKLSCLCYIFQGENLKGFISPAMYLCGIHVHYFDNCKLFFTLY